MMQFFICTATLVLVASVILPQIFAECIRTGNGYECIFPFIYSENQFTECTTEGGYDSWCAITVNSKNETTYWDYCRGPCADCETKGGYGPCIFPFSSGGKIHYFCIQEPDDTYEPWCAYETDRFKTMTEWAYCETDGQCPIKQSNLNMGDSEKMELARIDRIN